MNLRKITKIPVSVKALSKNITKVARKISVERKMKEKGLPTKNKRPRKLLRLTLANSEKRNSCSSAGILLPTSFSILSPFAENDKHKLADECEEFSASGGFCSRPASIACASMAGRRSRWEKRPNCEIGELHTL